MTKTEENQLDELLGIADEDDTPLSEKDIEFLRSLDEKRSSKMSMKQGEWFDDLVRKHLKD